MISPRLEIPAELEKQITVLDVPLPDVDELTEIAESMIKTAGIDVVVDPSVIGKAKGLTTLEAEDAFARSLVETGTLDGKTIADAKAQSWKKAGHELYEPEPLESLQGLDQLKTYIQSRKTGFANDKIPNPKGILLTGPPGTGKSLSAKVISSVLDFPLVRIDPTAISGSLVGESQQKTKDLWKMIKALSPCVVWIDEIEKMFGGVQSSGRTDGGTGAAVFGMFLTEMQEIREPVYIVATCNDIDQLLTISQGALLRRFDDVFFVDLPTESERKGILEYMVAKYGAEISADGIAALVAQTAGWTGAEIEKAVIANHYENDAFARMHPVYQQNKDNIDRARAWSRTNARRANAEETTTTNGNNNRRLAI